MKSERHPSLIRVPPSDVAPSIAYPERLDPLGGSTRRCPDFDLTLQSSSSNGAGVGVSLDVKTGPSAIIRTCFTAPPSTMALSAFHS